MAAYTTSYVSPSTTTQQVTTSYTKGTPTDAANYSTYYSNGGVQAAVVPTGATTSYYAARQTSAGGAGNTTTSYYSSGQASTAANPGTAYYSGQSAALPAGATTAYYSTGQTAGVPAGATTTYYNAQSTPPANAQTTTTTTTYNYGQGTLPTNGTTTYYSGQSSLPTNTTTSATYSGQATTPTNPLASTQYYKAADGSTYYTNAAGYTSTSPTNGGVYIPRDSEYVSPGHPLRGGMYTIYDQGAVPTFEAPLRYVTAHDNELAANNPNMSGGKLIENYGVYRTEESIIHNNSAEDFAGEPMTRAISVEQRSNRPAPPRIQKKKSIKKKGCCA